MIRPDWYSNPPAVVGPDPHWRERAQRRYVAEQAAHKQVRELARELKAQAERREMVRP